jgi:hypothetical protein
MCHLTVKPEKILMMYTTSACITVKITQESDNKLQSSLLIDPESISSYNLKGLCHEMNIFFGYL